MKSGSANTGKGLFARAGRPQPPHRLRVVSNCCSRFAILRQSRHPGPFLERARIEAVILGVDGVSDFNALHSGRNNEEVQLCAFDVLALDGDDLRRLPLPMRKAKLARLLARRPDGIFISAFEQGEIGPDPFGKACEFGLEGLVSKHRDGAYQGGRSKHGVKVKNRKHPATDRVT